MTSAQQSIIAIYCIILYIQLWFLYAYHKTIIVMDYCKFAIVLSIYSELSIFVIKSQIINDYLIMIIFTLIKALDYLIMITFELIKATWLLNYDYFQIGKKTWLRDYDYFRKLSCNQVHFESFIIKSLQGVELDSFNILKHSWIVQYMFCVSSLSA